MVVLVGMQVDGKTTRRPADVILYVDGLVLPPVVVGQGSRLTVNRMYAGLGIALAWHDGPRKSGGESGGAVAVQICFTSDTRSASPNALAFALPYASGVKTITVIYPRIHVIAGGNRMLELSLLAHVLAHEIGHVLQGTMMHSETGVMKVGWTSFDYAAMVRRPLDFEPEDVAAILRGLTVWKLSAEKTRGSAR